MTPISGFAFCRGFQISTFPVHVGVNKFSVFSIFRLFSSVAMAKNLIRRRCLRRRQRQPQQVHAGSPSAHQEDCSDRAYVVRPSASPARLQMGATQLYHLPSCTRAGLALECPEYAQSKQPP